MTDHSASPDLREAARRVLRVYDGRSKPEDPDYDYEGEPSGSGE